MFEVFIFSSFSFHFLYIFKVILQKQYCEKRKTKVFENKYFNKGRIKQRNFRSNISQTVLPLVWLLVSKNIAYNIISFWCCFHNLRGLRFRMLKIDVYSYYQIQFAIIFTRLNMFSSYLASYNTLYAKLNHVTCKSFSRHWGLVLSWKLNGCAKIVGNKVFKCTHYGLS